MSPERWQQIDSLFQAALTHPEGERLDFLKKACGLDGELLQEVQELLASHQQAGNFIASPAMEVAARAAVRDQSGSPVGKTIGSYEVVGLLGKGAMGEVYRARDRRIGREVAIKILPAIFSTDSERLRRFEQEARAVGRLNHPNVLVIHDVGTFEGRPFIVSELLEGETVREHLRGKPLAMAEAIDYAIQMARGLAAAHEKGIVHRDLKPENIYVTKGGRLKILDFGIAKLQTRFDATTAEATAGTASNSILGTVGYMSPEQIKGESADHRSDIFAFGAVLYEMVSGHRAFSAPSMAETMSAILKSEPAELSQFNPSVSLTLRQIVHRCLHKSADQRFQSASDLAFHLETCTSTQVPIASSKGPRSRQRLAWTIAALFLFLALALAVERIFERVPSQTAIVQFVISPPDKVSLSQFDAPAISPDGRQLAFVGVLSGKPLLWIRSLDSLSSRPLAGTEGSHAPFWSPDGRFIGFFARGKLRKVETAGGVPQAICDTAGFRGSWNSDGDIIYAQSGVIYRVHSEGGRPTPVTKLHPSRSEIEHEWPQFLPDGRHFLYLTVSAKAEYLGISVGLLDSTEVKPLLSGVSNAAYSAPGYLLFVREGVLQAQPFDATRITLTGGPIPVTSQISYGWGDADARFCVSQNGVLVYATGVGLSQQNKQLVWHSREGKTLGSVGEPEPYMQVELSPDEKQVVTEVIDPASRGGGNGGNLWLVDLARGVASRFESNVVSWEGQPHWSPDGNRIIYNSNEGGVVGLYSKEVAAVGKPELLVKGICFPTDWSKDGRFVVYERSETGTNNDLWVLPLLGENKGKPFPFLQSEFEEFGGQFSPDAKWMAYASDESGRDEVYVRSFPGPGPKWRVSTAGGNSPRWRADGKELYYLAADENLMAVPMKLGSSLEPGVPQPLFETQKVVTRVRYTMTGDGQRFLVITPVGETTPPSIAVVLNWTAVLKQ